jgi:hypothetical protein
MAKFDLFVSYAHEKEPTWARLLVKQLDSRVGELLGRPPKFYFDPAEMEQGAHVQPALIDAVRGSRLLLVVLSPKYLLSKWCLLELETFLDAGGDTTDHRIFVVEAERIDREEWPAQLRDKETMAFWEEDPDTKIAERLDPELGEKYAQTLKKRVGEIAHFVVARLKASPHEVPQYKGEVWIAEPTDDLIGEWEDLAAAVRQVGWRALPTSPYSTANLDDYTKAVRDHLSNAQLFVQLLGPTAGKRPAWSDLQFPILQANETREVLKKHNRVRWLCWRKTPPPPQEDRSPYAALLRDGNVQQSSFPAFKEEVIRYLSSDPLLPEPHEPPNVQVQLYVHNDAVDRTLADEIIESLANLDVFTARMPGLEPGKPISEQHRAVLQDCNGVVLVYGVTPLTWAWMNFELLKKNFISPRGSIGVLNGPPPETPRVELRGPRVVPLDCTTGINPAVLEGFVKQVRQKVRPEDDHA